MSAIIGRKQIILAALVLALGVAIVLNWKFTGSDTVTGTTSTLGAASYVSSTSTASSTDAYFSSARLTREQTRAKAEETLQTTINSVSASNADKQSAEAAIEALASNITKEGTVESLIKAKGFSDCVCFINDDSITVVVAPKSGDSLSGSEIAQVKDIVLEQTNISSDNIKIIQAK